MARVHIESSILRRAPKAGRSVFRRSAGKRSTNRIWAGLALLTGAALVALIAGVHARYTFTWQTPVRLRFQTPLVVSKRVESQPAHAAQFDQRHPLNAWQQYTCRVFGSSCRVALAIQRAENPQGKCEIYHYNADGTLDWGYFQINTVHLKRPGVNLRDLLDCKANIDYAYKLFVEKNGFTAWSTYNNGAYLRELREP